MGQVYGAMAALPHLKREGEGANPHFLNGGESITVTESLLYGEARFRGLSGILACRAET